MRKRTKFAVGLMALVAATIAVYCNFPFAEPRIIAPQSPQPAAGSTPVPYPMASVREAEGALGGRVEASSQPVFNGTIAEDVHQDRVVEGRAIDIILAPLSSVALSRPNGSEILEFRAFIVSSDGGRTPEAKQGNRISVRDGRWTMPIPTADIALVAAVVDGHEWNVVGSRRIPAGATSGKFLIRPPRTCTLSVITDDNASVSAATSLSLLAVPALPRGVATTLTKLPGEGLRPSSNHGSVQRVAVPPRDAEVIGTQLTSPIRFDAAPYARELWVGKDGYQWERLYWTAEDTDGEVRLGAAVELRVVVEGALRRGRKLGLQVLRGGRGLCQWDGIAQGRPCVLEGLGAGSCRLVVRDQRVVGSPCVLEREITIPKQPVFEYRLALADVQELRLGTILVGMYLPEPSLAAGASVILYDPRTFLSGPCAPGGAKSLTVHEKAEPAGIGCVCDATFEQVPMGTYLVTVSQTGACARAVVRENEQTVVSFDLANLQKILISPGSGPSRAVSEDVVLDWSSLGDAHTDGCSQEAVLASSQELTSQASWIDGKWCFYARPGPIALRLRDAASGNIAACGIIEVRPGECEFSLDRIRGGLGSVSATISNVKTGNDGEIASAVFSALLHQQGGAGRPSFIKSWWRSVKGDRGEIRIDFMLPIGSWFLPANPHLDEAGVVWETSTFEAKVGEVAHVCGRWK